MNGTWFYFSVFFGFLTMTKIVDNSFTERRENKILKILKNIFERLTLQ
jgi:hypothetical protein